MKTAAVEDAVLESMTQQLLQISSVFLVQQTELQQVRERLSKELARVSLIQDALTTAAQQHQDAVLTVIQNYEHLNLPCEPTVSTSLDTRTSASATASTDPPQLARESRHRSMRQVHLPPVVARPVVFAQTAAVNDPDDEDEGIRYVDKLQVVGGILGVPLKASGDFVGSPQAQWLRQKSRTGHPIFLPIEGARELEYSPNADDVGACLRLECVGPYGGTPVRVDTDPIGLDPTTHAELEELLRRGHAEFHASTPQQEPRIILVTRKNIKVRSKLSRLTTSATTLYKQTYDIPLTVVVDQQSPTELELKLGPHTFSFSLEVQRSRDLAALCIRMFAGPNCPAHDTESETDEVEPALVSDAESARDEPPTNSAATALEHVMASPAHDADIFDEEVDDVKKVQWSGDEEEEEFKPAITVSIRSKEDAYIADANTLKNFSLGLAPPKASSRRRNNPAAVAIVQPPEHPPSDETAAASIAASTTIPSTPADAAADSSNFAVVFDDSPFEPQIAPPRSPPLPSKTSSAEQLSLACETGTQVAALDADVVVLPATPTTFDGADIVFDGSPFEVPTANAAKEHETTFRTVEGGSCSKDSALPVAQEETPAPWLAESSSNAVDAHQTADFIDESEPQLASSTAPAATSVDCEIATPASSQLASDPLPASGQPDGPKQNPVGMYNLLVSETVNAHLCGKQLLDYQVVGELRIVPLGTENSQASEFRFRFKNAHRIEQIKVNDKFVKVNAGAYVVQLPAQQHQIVPLIKYTASSKWRPVPVFLDISLEHEDSTQVTMRATVETNPQLKTPLQDVVVSINPGSHAEDCAVVAPGTWESGERRLQWRLPHLLSRDKPFVCTAELTGSEDLASTVVAQPTSVQFKCEGVTISGIELEVQMDNAGTSPVAHLLRRFASGDYKVSAQLPDAGEPTSSRVSQQE
mmetsp:Transcript_46738/g.77372  ORF Transcript_46738/g.77372 Transcript_46738/m.77372 type:complete len:928 (+) Transcript_46738:63-2846(+)